MTDSEGNELGKLFVGGLSQSTNNDSLRSYFSQFGDVEEAIVMMDNRTGRSRGFGYVKYKNADIVDAVLESRPHMLDSKEIDAKQCNINMKGRNRRSLKIFVGGIALDQEAETIRSFFEQYGIITDVNLMMDQTKQRHRGFAFVGFEDENVVKRLIAMHYVTINGKQVEIKAMEPPNYGRKQNSPQPPSSQMSPMCSKGAGDNRAMNAQNGQSLYRQSAPYAQQPVNWQNHPGQMNQNWVQSQWPQWQQNNCDHSQWNSWSYQNGWYQPTTAVYPQNSWPPAPPQPPPQQTVQWSSPTPSWDPQAGASQWMQQPQTPTHTSHIHSEYEQDAYDQKTSISCGPMGQLPSMNQTSPDYSTWLYNSKDVKMMTFNVDGEGGSLPPGGSGDYNRAANPTPYPYHVRR